MSRRSLETQAGTALVSDYIKRGLRVNLEPVRHLVHGRVLLADAIDTETGTVFDRFAYAAPADSAS